MNKNAESPITSTLELVCACIERLLCNPAFGYNLSCISNSTINGETLFYENDNSYDFEKYCRFFNFIFNNSYLIKTNLSSGRFDILLRRDYRIKFNLQLYENQLLLRSVFYQKVATLHAIVV